MDYEDKQFQVWVRRLADLELSHAISQEKLGRVERRLATLLREGVARKPSDASPIAPRSGVPPLVDVPPHQIEGGIAPSEAKDYVFADEAVT